jgi:tellurite resistance protein TerC
VLFWGVLGAIAFRGVLIAFGVSLITNFAWIMIVLEVFLIFTGIKMLLISNTKLDITQTFFFKWITRKFNIIDVVDSGKFYIVKENTLYFTPLFLALITVEFMDLVFAIDSIPAILAITSDPYIVYTSNIFAILGLRSLYLLLADMLERFYYLKTSLAVILIFIGSKNFAAKSWGFDSFPSNWSLIIIILIITVGLLCSKKHQEI